MANDIANTEEKLIINTRTSFYNGSLPCFYSQEEFPELFPLIQNWQSILQEVKQYEMAHGSISGIDTYSPPELNSTNVWSNVYLRNFMWNFKKNQRFFPITYSVINQIGGCTLAAVSILAPGGKIAPHYGDTNAIIRCHLGLDIPEAYPTCGIRVKDEEKGWANGSVIIFTEAHRHTTWNLSKKKRYLLVVDIIHPKWRDKKLLICSKVLGAQSYVFLEKKIALLKKLPDFAVASLQKVFSIVWYFYLSIQNLLFSFPIKVF